MSASLAIVITAALVLGVLWFARWAESFEERALDTETPDETEEAARVSQDTFGGEL